MEDQKIVSLFFERNEAAIEACRDKYGAMLNRLSYHIVQDLQSAEECENDTYLQAWQRIPPHKPDDYLYAFLAKITRNISLNYCLSQERLKRKAHICQLSDEMAQCIPDSRTVDAVISEKELTNAINGFLRSMDIVKRNLFIRRYWYLDSIRDLSRMFGMTDANVKTTLHRCHKMLRQHLEKEDILL